MTDQTLNIKKVSRLEDDPEHQGCLDMNHLPGLMGLYIPPGQRYVHVCPTCGHETIIRSSHIRC